MDVMFEVRSEYPYITPLSKHTHGQKGPARSHGPDQPALAPWTGIKARVQRLGGTAGTFSPPQRQRAHRDAFVRTQTRRPALPGPGEP